MRIYLNDFHCRRDLYPFTQTRHTGDIRIGILTIREKWERLTGAEVIMITEQEPEEGIIIGANIVPSLQNYKDILSRAKKKKHISLEEDIYGIHYPWNISQDNHKSIKEDFELLTRKRKSAKISDTNRISRKGEVFMEKGAIMEHCIINAEGGPVYIGKDAHVMEGCLVRGSFAICEGSVLKMGTKAYSGTTIGPWCVAGGEIKNSVFFGFSNKAHDGYIGDSVIGEWCNLGAGTSNSNIKNTAQDVTLVVNGDPVNAGNKVGLIMGDYSRAAINTSFNTGTIVGICCNIFGSGFPARAIPDFTWGNNRYILDKAMRDIENWKRLKNHTLTEIEVTTLQQLYSTI